MHTENFKLKLQMPEKQRYSFSLCVKQTNILSKFLNFVKSLLNKYFKSNEQKTKMFKKHRKYFFYVGKILMVISYKCEPLVSRHLTAPSAAGGKVDYFLSKFLSFLH